MNQGSEDMDEEQAGNYDVQATAVQIGGTEQSMHFPAAQSVILMDSALGTFDIAYFQKMMASLKEVQEKQTSQDERQEELEKQLDKMRREKMDQDNQLVRQHNQIQRQESQLTKDSAQHEELHQRINDLEGQKEILEERLEGQDRQLKKLKGQKRQLEERLEIQNHQLNKLNRKLKGYKCFMCMKGTVTCCCLCIKAGRYGSGRALDHGLYLKM